MFICRLSVSNCVLPFTISATVVGGAFINGTAEMIASSGLLWTVAPLGYCIGLFIGKWELASSLVSGNWPCHW